MKEEVNSSKSWLKSYEINGAKSLYSPLILCLLILLQFFPLNQTPIHQRTPYVIPLQKGTYTQLQRKLQSVINVQEVALL